jgi:hypothetical protein
MQREKIEFPTNTPVVLKLDWDEGTLKPGRFGDEYMYVCDNDARIMWVKPELHTLIQQSGARAGDEIAITKREVKDGSRRRTQWEVEKVEEEPAASPAPAPPRQAQPASRTSQPPQPAKPVHIPAPQPAPEIAAQLCEVHREANCSPHLSLRRIENTHTRARRLSEPKPDTF